MIVATPQLNVSFEQDMSEWTERADRLTTILLVGRIVTSSGDHLCRIRNISAGGMLVETDARLVTDEAVRIELRNMNAVSGRARWMRDHRVGIQFDAPIEVAAFLHQPAGSSLRSRAPRLAASCPVVVWHIGRSRAATLLDLSQTGCRLVMPGPLADGTDVRITIPNLPARHAMQRWTHAGSAGFSFHEPLPLADLMAWDAARDA